MTTFGLDSRDDLPDHPAVSGAFHISLARLEELNRSPLHLIAKRLTPDCPSYDQPFHGLEAEDLIQEIREFHADSEDFIHYEMPIKEIVFRTLLARGNEPMSVSDIHYELTGRWSNANRHIYVEEALLKRVLEADTYYGFGEA